MSGMWRLNTGKGMGELLLLPAVQVDITPFSERMLSDSHPAFFLPIATTSNKNF